MIGLSSLLMDKPHPVPLVGRVVKMADVEPGRLTVEAAPKKAQAPYRQPAKKALTDTGMDFDRAMVLARRWAKFRCRPEMEPVRQVLRQLLARIDEMEAG